MAAWGQRLMAPDLVAVSSYIKSLNGIVPPPNANSLRALTADAGRGRDLFFDMTKELGSCANCHAVSGKGVTVAPAITHVPESVAALRSLPTPGLKTAAIDGENIPALIIGQVRGETKLFDLTTVPPVLRTLPSSAVKLMERSAWRHSTVLGAYTNPDLELILSFLRATAQH